MDEENQIPEQSQSAIPGWYQRLVEEQKDLNDKINKLALFTTIAEYSELSEFKRDLLHAQWRAMETYNQILQIRIKTK